MNCCCEGTSRSPQEQVDISVLSSIIDEYGKEESNTITLLQKTQEIYGYLPLEALRHIANVTGMSEARLYGVATFYTQFRMTPVGEHMILLCQGTACHVNGADAIQNAITEELGIEDGETTEDQLFTLSVVACLGCCSLAPVMMIGDETYANLTPEKTVKILREIREGGKS